MSLQWWDQVPHFLVDGSRLLVRGQILLELDPQHLIFFSNLKINHEAVNSKFSPLPTICTLLCQLRCSWTCTNDYLIYFEQIWNVKKQRNLSFLCLLSCTAPSLQVDKNWANVLPIYSASKSSQSLKRLTCASISSSWMTSVRSFFWANNSSDSICSICLICAFLAIWK